MNGFSDELLYATLNTRKIDNVFPICKSTLYKEISENVIYDDILSGVTNKKLIESSYHYTDNF